MNLLMKIHWHKFVLNSKYNKNAKSWHSIQFFKFQNLLKFAQYAAKFHEPLRRYHSYFRYIHLVRHITLSKNNKWNIFNNETDVVLDFLNASTCICSYFPCYYYAHIILRSQLFRFDEMAHGQQTPNQCLCLTLFDLQSDKLITYIPGSSYLILCKSSILIY